MSGSTISASRAPLPLFSRKRMEPVPAAVGNPSGAGADGAIEQTTKDLLNGAGFPGIGLRSSTQRNHPVDFHFPSHSLWPSV